MTITPHFRLPFTFTSNGVQEVEQDTDEEIQQCVYAYCAYDLGSLMCRPDFGMPEQVWREGGANLDQIQLTIEEWDSRAVEIIERDSDFLPGLVETVTLRKDNSGTIYGGA